MEEQIGKLWHRLVTRAAERRFPEAAVELDAMTGVLGVFFRALGGDPGARVQAVSQSLTGARRSWLQRLAGSGRKAELAWLDPEALRLPARIDVFPERALNRDLYLWLAALAALDRDPYLPWLRRNQAATLDVCRRFPGLSLRYRRLVEAHLAQRRSPQGLPPDEAAQEHAIRQALLWPGSVDRLPVAQRPCAPVPLWLHPDPSRPMGQADASEQEPAPAGDGAERKAARRHAAEYVEMPESGKNLLLLRPESLLSWTEYLRMNSEVQEDDETEANQAEDDLDQISIARDRRATSRRLRMELDLPAAQTSAAPLNAPLLLPEWDYRRRLLQADHCRLRVLDPPAQEEGRLPDHLLPPARRLRAQFRTLQTARIWRRAQPDGTEIDLDAYIRHRAAGSARTPGAARVYRDVRRRQRDLACLLLADLSLSTEAWVGASGRVIDVIRDSLYLFSEALAASGDRFALYGFSSHKRTDVRLQAIKPFAVHYDAAVRSRIGAIRPGEYTRMGAAIRYATQVLAKEHARQRLLLLLSDGKPNDVDQYEGRYGLEDTREALRSARRAGVRPFCITVDREAGDYLPHIFGQQGFIVIQRPAELPRRLPLLYMQLAS